MKVCNPMLNLGHGILNSIWLALYCTAVYTRVSQLEAGESELAGGAAGLPLGLHHNTVQNKGIVCSIISGRYLAEGWQEKKNQNFLSGLVQLYFSVKNTQNLKKKDTRYLPKNCTPLLYTCSRMPPRWWEKSSLEPWIYLQQITFTAGTYHLATQRKTFNIVPEELSPFVFSLMEFRMYWNILLALQRTVLCYEPNH